MSLTWDESEWDESDLRWRGTEMMRNWDDLDLKWLGPEMTRTWDGSQWDDSNLRRLGVRWFGPEMTQCEKTRTWDDSEWDVSSPKCLGKWAVGLCLFATSRPKLGTKHSPQYWPVWPPDRHKDLPLVTWFSGLSAKLCGGEGGYGTVGHETGYEHYTALLPMLTGWDYAKRSRTRESTIKWP